MKHIRWLKSKCDNSILIIVVVIIIVIIIIMTMIITIIIIIAITKTIMIIIIKNKDINLEKEYNLILLVSSVCQKIHSLLLSFRIAITIISISCGNDFKNFWKLKKSKINLLMQIFGALKGVCGTHMGFDLKLGATIVETIEAVIDKLSRCIIGKISGRCWCIFTCEDQIVIIS